jgi:hypothetical protein
MRAAWPPPCCANPAMVLRGNQGARRHGLAAGDLPLQTLPGQRPASEPDPDCGSTSAAYSILTTMRFASSERT